MLILAHPSFRHYMDCDHYKKLLLHQFGIKQQFRYRAKLKKTCFSKYLRDQPVLRLYQCLHSALGIQTMMDYDAFETLKTHLFSCIVQLCHLTKAEEYDITEHQSQHLEADNPSRCPLQGARHQERLVTQNTNCPNSKQSPWKS